ncbi:hydantoinase/oxoprolinase family protein [Polycladomyces sp. WAk]|uniref:Hydantoinase/oxoprolinase family protein n=1 Tax=Polycladomyces zharkentensis TaxID=2807616 RepID=A0ABS2WKA0_9BACL|nr:hydantoinase/oxoprolinase family protein [Polycladomyces sp. WAk]
MTYRIGIDVGGTNTDAVLLDDRLRLVTKVKVPTTPDVETGICEALHRVIKDSGVPPEHIGYAMLGTTHCTNAIVERKRLNRVGIIRIGLPATTAVPPMTAWPADLKAELSPTVAMVKGGVEYDGRMIAPLDEEAVRAACQKMMEKVDAVAITSVFSPVSREHEERAAAIVAEEMGADVPVSLSHEIGSIGLLERENATIVNAALIMTARTVAEGFRRALEREGIRARLFFGQNDGTLMSVEYAQKYPIRTIACGPTNSIRGAAHLSGCTDGVVIDVGGTTTDVGVLVRGYPRESSVAVEIGGIRTHFRMPDLLSVGIGGGTLVRVENGRVRLGPDSVGYRLVEKGLAFGGDAWTLTDTAVALGVMKGERMPLLDRDRCEQVYRLMVAEVEEALDRMKTQAGPVPVVLVGGGSAMLPEQLAGASEVIRPDHFEVANAVGAGIGQIGGQVDRIYSLADQSRDQALAEAEETARADAVQAGADPSRLQVVEVEEIPLAYLPGNAVRIRVKVAGPFKGCASPF